MKTFILSVAVCVALAHGVLSQGTNGPMANTPTQPQGAISTNTNTAVAQNQQNNAYPMAQNQNNAYPMAQTQNNAYPMAQGQNNAYPMAQGQNNAYAMAQGQNNAYSMTQGQNNVFPMAQGQNTMYPMAQGQQNMYPMDQSNLYSMGAQQSSYPMTMGYTQQATHNYPAGFSNPMYNTIANQQNPNTQANTESSNSFMNYLPFMLGGERGRQLATYSMMMNPNGNNNMMLPFLLNGEHRSMLPMMALMNRGGQRMNPVVMSMMMGQELI